MSSEEAGAERAREVLEYFLRNPQAADSLEGVARWRMLEETIHRHVADIERALQWLVAKGFLVQRAPAGTEPIFSLNPARASEARDFLADDSGPTRTR